MKNIVVGTAGHIDHGKTTLIKGLTGIETDRLKEEKKRGITIELGFAYFDLPSGKRVGIVDVPGHEKFIKNMLAGVSGIDIVLFVIAADEGVMPQTQEHLDILSILDVDKGIVVLTKVDLVDEEWLEMVKIEIQEKLEGSFLEGAPFMEVSAVSGLGLEELKQLIDSMTEEVVEKKEEAPLRLPIDRVFSVSGFGTVITGTVFEGTVRIGDTVEIFPTGKLVKVRNIQVHSVDKEEAYAGQRVALNLAGIKKDEISRGDIIGQEESLKSAMMIDVKLELLKSSNREIGNWTRLRLYHGTREILCRVVLLDKDVLVPGESGYAQLRLEEEIACKYGDKFVVRFYSPLETIGGGRILDSNAMKHKRFKTNVIEDLESKSAGRKEDIVEAIIEKHEDQLINGKYLVQHIGIGEEELETVLSNLIEDKLIERLKDGSLIHSSILYKKQKEITVFLEGYHKQYPFREGVLKEEIRNKHFSEIKMKVVNELLGILSSKEVLEVNGNYVKKHGFLIEYNERASKFKNGLLKSLLDEKFMPSLLKELEDTYRSEKYFKDIFNNLVVNGEIVRISDTIYLHKDNYEKAKQMIKTFLSDNSQMSLAEVRDLLETSRKYIVPIMEHFDTIGLTKRDGEARVLK